MNSTVYFLIFCGCTLFLHHLFREKLNCCWWPTTHRVSVDLKWNTCACWGEYQSFIMRETIMNWGDLLVNCSPPQWWLFWNREIRTFWRWLMSGGRNKKTAEKRSERREREDTERNELYDIVLWPCAYSLAAFSLLPYSQCTNLCVSCNCYTLSWCLGTRAFMAAGNLYRPFVMISILALDWQAKYRIF